MVPAPGSSQLCWVEKRAYYQVVKTPRQRCAKVPTPHAELDLLPAFRTVLEDDYNVGVTVVKLMFLL